MSYRPYPNVDRALRQLDRHYAPALPVPVRYVIGLGRDVGDIRAMTEDEVATLRQREQSDVAEFPVGTYVLSTQRPGVVGTDG